jgi:hypothetical protein
MEIKSSNKFILTNDTTTIIELHRNEMELIKALRTKFRFGEVVIIVRDGLPVQLKRTTEFENLDKGLDKKD